MLTQELCHVCAVSYPTVLQAARAAGGAGAPLVVSLEPHSLADVLATIELVATLAGVEARGERVIAALRARLAALEPPTRRPDLALIEWLDPLFAPGHWGPEQIERAGGAPVIGVRRESSWDSVAAADPDVVVLGLCGFDLPRTLLRATSAAHANEGLARRSDLGHRWLRLRLAAGPAAGRRG